jgi:hypothetical protein
MKLKDPKLLSELKKNARQNSVGHFGNVFPLFKTFLFTKYVCEVLCKHPMSVITNENFTHAEF